MKPNYLLIAALMGVLVVTAGLFLRPDPPDARIVAALTNLGARDVQRHWIPPSIIEQNAFIDRYTFTFGQAEGGGELFRCATKQDCDTLVPSSAAGSLSLSYYVYQSARGTTVVRVGSYLEVRTALRFYDAIRDLP